MLKIQPRLLVVLGLILCGSHAAHAVDPRLRVMEPRGIQRGTEADVLIRGTNLQDSKELLVFEPGVTVTSVEAKDNASVACHIKVDKDARIGEYHIRMRTETGVSDLRTFYVGPFEIVPFKPTAKPDKRGRVYFDFEHPVDAELNKTISGSLGQEQVQYFAVNMKKGQRLCAEVHGMRLGDQFDPTLTIYDERRFELAVSDDTALGRQDPIAACVIPADGRYIVALRESTYAGGQWYLLHIGDFPRPTAVYPMGGKPGETLNVKFLGDPLGPIDGVIKLPEKPVDVFSVQAEQNGLTSPSPNFITVSDMPNVLEQEPNDEFSTATAYDGPLPVALNGVIEKPGDIDFFKFKAHRGDDLDIRVLARSLRSPIDTVMTLYNGKGNVIASNDDSNGPDSYIRFNVPADGEYAISITDHLKTGGPDYAYRVEITKARKELVFSIPTYQQNSQERWTAPVPRGNRYATFMRLQRTNVNGDVQLSMPELPPGVKASSPIYSEGDMQAIVFEAAADAPIGPAKLCPIVGKALDPKQASDDVRSKYEQKIGLVYSGNDYLYTTDVYTYAVSVTNEAPYKIHVEQPKVPLVQGGAMKLKVTVERAKDFTGPVNVRMLYNPPNINSIPNIDISPTQTEGEYEVSATPNATLRTWQICLVGQSDAKGQLWVSSELIDLTIGEPYLAASTKMTPIEQGKDGTVTYKLEQKTPFTGKAKAKLLGLPSNVTADEAEISSSDTSVSFPVHVGEKATAGTHGGMYINLVIMKDGQELMHNIGRNAVLRVDRPAGAVAAEAAAKKAAKAKTDKSSNK